MCPSCSRFNRCASRRPCQKSPSQNTASLRRAKTRSGRPGSRATSIAGWSRSRRSAAASATSQRVPDFLLDARARSDAAREAAVNPE
ncbi:MAG TPA: hypothetical protein VFB81_24050 [Myxococcales bacterium]|nr:hypothetical protein [Myxococcales bacterium]